MTLKSKKFGQKLNCGFQVSPKTIWWVYFQKARRVEFSNFIGLFCLKDKLPKPITFTRIPFCDTQGPWKVWAKAELWFRNQPKRIWWISFRQTTRVKFSNFIGLFCLKGKLPEPNLYTGIPFFDTSGSWKVWAKTEFQISPKKMAYFFISSKWKGSKF